MLKKNRRPSVIEKLESRRMLTMSYFGTAGNDTISISVQAGGGMTIVQINGVNNLTADTEINVNAGAGDDLFRVFNTRVGVLTRLNGEAGNDTCENPGTLDLDAVYNGPTFFFGGSDFDVYFADNRNDTTPAASIDISRTAITRGVEGAISLFDQIEHLEYRDNNSSNRISFTNVQNSTREITTIAINANGGNDTITNIYSTSSVGPWSTCMGSGGAFVDGGSGTDILLLSNDNGGSGVHTLTSSRITVSMAGSDAGPLDYVGIEGIDFDVTSVTGIGDDVIHLRSKPVGTLLSFDSGPGDDEFIVGNGDLDSNGWGSATLAGGAGNDSIIFDDELDTQADGSTSNYTLNAQALLKGNQLASYSGFESQTLKSANGVVVGQLNVVPAVNINATESAMQATTISGGAARSTSVTLGNGSFANLFGSFGVFLDGGFLDRLTINDSIAGGLVNAYEVNSMQVRRTHTDVNLNQTIHLIDYTGVSQLTLNASDVFDTIHSRGTPAGMTLNINANAGNDTFNLGDGNIDAELLGPVTFNGGAGTNSVTISNGLDMQPESQVLNGLSFTDGVAHGFSSISSLVINEGPGGTDLAVNAVSVPTTINGGAGNDSFTVGGGDIDANVPVSSSAAPALVLNGSTGFDTIRFDDINGPNVDSYVFQRAGAIDQLDKTDAGIHRWMSWGTTESVILDASNAPTPGGPMSGIVVSDIATPLRINGNDGNDWVQIFDAQQPITVNTGMGGMDRLDVNFDFDAEPMTVIMDQSDDIETLNVHAPAVLRVTDDAVLTKTRLAPFPANPNINGVLDLSGGAFLSRAGGPAPAEFRAKIIAGHNGGAWNGTGGSGAINSSLAAGAAMEDCIGYGSGAEIAVSTIGPFAIDAGDTLIRYTLAGDANLDTAVDTVDFNTLAVNFSQAVASFAKGDFNYDGLVDSLDFNLLATNFGSAIPSGLTRASKPGALREAVLPQTNDSAAGSIFSDKLLDLQLPL